MSLLQLLAWHSCAPCDLLQWQRACCKLQWQPLQQCQIAFAVPFLCGFCPATLTVGMLQPLQWEGPAAPPGWLACSADPLKFMAGLEVLALCDYSLSIKASHHCISVSHTCFHKV